MFLHSDPILEETAEWLGSLSSGKAHHALSLILELPDPQIRQSLSSQSLLVRSGLVCMDRSGQIARMGFV